MFFLFQVEGVHFWKFSIISSHKAKMLPIYVVINKDVSKKASYFYAFFRDTWDLLLRNILTTIFWGNYFVLVFSLAICSKVTKILWSLWNTFGFGKCSLAPSAPNCLIIFGNLSEGVKKSLLTTPIFSTFSSRFL